MLLNVQFQLLTKSAGELILSIGCCETPVAEAERTGGWNDDTTPPSEASTKQREILKMLLAMPLPVEFAVAPLCTLMELEGMR